MFNIVINNNIFIHAHHNIMLVMGSSPEWTVSQYACLTIQL